MPVYIGESCCIGCNTTGWPYLFSELLQQRRIFGIGFLCHAQSNCIYLQLLLLPRHLLPSRNKVSREPTPKFTSGSRTPPAWKAISILRVLSLENTFSDALENTGTSFHSPLFVFTPILSEVGILGCCGEMFAVFLLIFLLSKLLYVSLSF